MSKLDFGCFELIFQVALLLEAMDKLIFLKWSEHWLTWEWRRKWVAWYKSYWAHSSWW